MEYFWIAIAIVILLGLALAGAPLFIVIGAGSAVFIVFVAGISIENLPGAMFTALDSYTLLAIPLFIFAGLIMARGGASKALVEFVDSLIGHLPGGLAIVTILSCMIFSAISGSTGATAAAIGTVMIGTMVDYGYDKGFACALVATGGTLGILIPPSITMILYSALTDTSVAHLFMAGMIPGLLVGLILMAASVLLCIKRRYVVHPPVTWKRRWHAFKKGGPVLLMPVIVLGGIYSGIWAPTEAAAMSAVYGIFICRFFYRELNLKKLLEILSESMSLTAVVLCIAAAAKLLAMVLTYTRVPIQITEFAARAGVTPLVFLMLINAVFFLFGMFLDTIAILYIVVPTVFLTLVSLNIDLVHFGIIMVLNTEIALITPPFGMNLFTISSVAAHPVENIYRNIYPFVLAMVVGLLLITYLPKISLFLPALLLG